MNRTDFYVLLFTGPAGSGKTGTGLSGDGATGVIELDPHSYTRAISGITVDKSRIHLHRIPSPVDALWDLGKVQVGSGGGVAPTATRSLKGWRESYEKFLEAYAKELADDATEQIMIDTDTRLSRMVDSAWQQQMQEAQRAANKAELERMEPLKYTESKNRYQMISDAAAIYGKHLILTSHMKPEYKDNQPTGKLIHDGNKEAPNNADLQLEFSIMQGKVVAVIKKSLGHLKLVGMRIEEPSIPKLISLLDGVQLINDSGLALPTPLTLDAVVGLAESLRD